MKGSEEKNGIPARAAKSEKLEQVADFCESIAAENEKVLLFYAHREESIWLQELLTERKISYCTVKDKNFIEKGPPGKLRQRPKNIFRSFLATE